MEFFRTAANPWGQSVLLGIAWDLMWVAIIAGLAFVVVHAIYVGFVAKPAAAAEVPAAPPDIPERLERHSVSARLSHWLMALAMFALLVTAFFPVLGIQFAWVTLHWIAGIVLLLAVLYHILHATLRQDFRAMWIEKGEVAEGMRDLRGFFRLSADSEQKRNPKYALDHKLYHHLAAIAGLAVIVSGVLMMIRIDTLFWNKNPYFLSDGTWGFIYVLHGLSGVALITLIMAHVYFAIRPEKRWMTQSMIRGWIGRDDYLRHHDPDQWKADAPGV